MGKSGSVMGGKRRKGLRKGKYGNKGERVGVERRWERGKG